MDIIFQKDRRTRTTHQCFGCGRNFDPPRIMQESCIADGGTVYRTYLCRICKYIVNTELEYNDYFSEGQLYDRAIELEQEEKELIDLTFN